MHFFIPGMSRCGTTWISSWLGNNPLIFKFSEIYAVYHAVRPVGGLPALCKDQALVDRCRTTIEQNYISRIASKAKLPKYATKARTFQHTLEKSPGNLAASNGGSYIDIINLLFPECRILCFYRNPVDRVYSSVFPPPDKIGHWPWQQTIKIWMVSEKYITPNSPPPNTMYVKYEDVMAEPSDMSYKICSFLGIPIHSVLEPWVKPINTVNKSFDPERWRRLPKEVIEEMKEMNPSMERLGYPTI